MYQSVRNVIQAKCGDYNNYTLLQHCVLHSAKSYFIDIDANLKSTRSFFDHCLWLGVNQGRDYAQRISSTISLIVVPETVERRWQGRANDFVRIHAPEALMTQCFKDHECDELKLHRNTKPIYECKSIVVEENGRKIQKITVPILTCEDIWFSYQKEAEDIVAPGGILIADPRGRNRAINAAYARLWLFDPRFQWAGLAAFASKQVGCGLLHAAATIRQIQHGTAVLREIEVDPIIWLASPSVEATAIVADGTLSVAQQQYRYVYEKLALGNTTLFLDVFPLHAFYKKRGLAELKTCIGSRKKIYGSLKRPVLWPVGQETLRFGMDRPQILQAFEAIEKGDITASVRLLAWHEQVNILLPTMYDDPHFKALLRANQAAYVTGLGSGVAEAIELTLASRCQRIDDGRTVAFDNSLYADLSDIKQRMPFVLRAAERFDLMVHHSPYYAVEKSLQQI
ncbi:hypothetical protein, partial [Rugamonas sp.]|uniref:DUF2515 family protein n=1 Tax=Rugamonas sp. TaxID=1926287 RepID=UPI0025F828B7